MTKDEALKLALEALEYHTAQTRPIHQTNEAITAIKEALAQPEPVAWEQFYPDMGKPQLTPPQRTWVGLTPQERDEINEKVYGAVPHHVAFHHAIEAKLKEKNT